MKEGKIKEYAKFIKLEILGTSIVGVLGALTIKGADLEFTNFIILFLMGILGHIVGNVHNDIKDYKIDIHSKRRIIRPLVKGTISFRSAWGIIFLCLIFELLLALVFFRRILPISILILSMFIAAIYNRFSKKIIIADVFIAGSAALFCLFGAVAVSPNIQRLQDIPSLTWIVVCFIFINWFFIIMVLGGLKDVDDDRKAGAKTLAVALGVKTTERIYIPFSYKIFGFLMKFIGVTLVFIPFLFFDLPFWIWQVILIVLIDFIILFLVVKVLNMRAFEREKISQYILFQEIISGFLIPMMLIVFIGITWSLFLILLPLLWFMLFATIIYGSPTKLPKTY